MPSLLTAAQCKGCGTTAVGLHCHQCGQVAEPAVPTLHTLTRDAVSALSADGKAWRSCWLLLTHPEELSLAYLRGARSPFLSPVQLLLLSVVPALLVGRMVSRRDWGMLYDFTLQVPSALLGEWAAWGVLLLAVPAMALALRVLFIRRSKSLSEHVVVSLHYFSAVLVLAALQTALVPVGLRVPASLSVLEWGGVIWSLVLGFRLMRGVYSTSVWGAAWRMTVLTVSYLLGYMGVATVF